MIDLMQRQIELEQEMVRRGEDRYERHRREAEAKGQASTVKAFKIVTDAALVPLADAIRDYFEDSAKKRAGALRTAHRLLGHVDPVALAYVVLHASMDRVVQDRLPFASFATYLGRAVEIEAYFAQEAADRPDLTEARVRDIDRRSDTTGHRRIIARHAMGASARAGEVETWTNADALHVGTKLVELLADSTGLIEVAQIREGRKLVANVRPTSRLRAWLVDLHMSCALMSPAYLPTVVPPKPWTALEDGGYHTDALLHPVRMVKTSNKRHLAELEKADLSRVMAGLNAIQNTAWAINTRVLEVVGELMAAGATVAGLPPLEDEPLPARPADFTADKDVTTAWKAAASAVYRRNAKMLSKRVQALQAVHLAREFEEYRAIYFPHQCDFRGRAYPVLTALSPQGPDLHKGLLQFSEGKPLGTLEAVSWFVIHGANCFGVDKVSFADRAEWVRDHYDAILACARNPLDETWWQEADSPFCFLAWCFEYADMTSAPIYPTTFVSRLPIAVDGSCNGLQHYSAMLQDPRGGAATNLVPAAAPKDIYGEVAADVILELKRLTADPAADPVDAEWAAIWLAFGIDRTLCKRPVMVLPYGGTLNACQRYVTEIVDDAAPGRYVGDPSRLSEGITWLARRVWQAMTRVVVGAVVAMGWLRDLSRAVSDEGRPLIWTSPSGFVVYQDYRPEKLVQVETVLFGRRFAPALREEIQEGGPDKRKQANGLPPNFVHSLDAAAMILTVNRARAAGITSFAMIHDSYGTHAADMPALSHILREVFVEMYEAPILQNLRDEVLPGGTEKQSFEPPFVGGLDLRGVLLSDYFFA